MSLQGFAVSPKLDCPHLKSTQVQELVQFLTKINNKHFSEFECAQCKDKAQNWICFQCRQIECSRYVKSHMVEHNSKTKHPIALSFSDASIWCYDCDSYIDAPSLRAARITLSQAKFAMVNNQSEQLNQEKIEELKLKKEFEKMNIKDKVKGRTVEEVVEGLKNKSYKNVTVLTGAGLSVAAGIPDFRTPGTGLYSKLQSYNLPQPQAVFDIKYFIKNPQPFTKLAKQFFNGKCQPTLGHKFIKKLDDQKMLLINLTQNIDDLQILAGLPQQKLIQAHGHSRSAHCIGCKKQGNIQQWKKATQLQQPLKCQCGSFIKPDIVFFGQQLPQKFYDAPTYMEQSDLVFIIGTSLAVVPFAFLAHMIPANVPVVLINNTDSLPSRQDKLWMKGDIQQSIQIFLQGLNWKL